MFFDPTLYPIGINVELSIYPHITIRFSAWPAYCFRVTMLYFYIATAVMIGLCVIGTFGIIQQRNGRILWMTPTGVGATIMAGTGLLGERHGLPIWSWLGAGAFIIGFIVSLLVWHRLPANLR